METWHPLADSISGAKHYGKSAYELCAESVQANNIKAYTSVQQYSHKANQIPA